MSGAAEWSRPWAGWRRALVVGLGTTGLSCVRFLAAQGVAIAATDSRVHPPALDAVRAEFPGLPLTLGEFEPREFSAVDALVVSPGVSLREPAIVAARQRGVQVTGDVDLFAAMVSAPVVAITGSNGKSTVTALLGEMARRGGARVAVGGNLGVPLLELLDPQAALYVIELSSFQLETAHRLRAAAATVLNLTEDHLDRYRDLAEYRAAKERVFAGDGTMVLNADDPQVASMAVAGRRTLWFGLGAPREGGFGLIAREGATWLAHGDDALLPADALRLAGRHNLANALAALALGTAVALPREPMLEALREFAGLEHRCQWVAQTDGVDWYNDSKATNVGAAVAAIEGFDRPLVLIAGGDAKGADLAPLREPVSRRVRAAILIGRDAPRMDAALAGACELVHAPDMAAAVRRAAELARSGDAVLLSPACASLDMFGDFAHRGREFERAVRELSA